MVQQPSATPVLLIGAGMIAHDQVLPALLQMCREGAIGEVAVCSRRASSTHALDHAPAIRRAFPDTWFRSVVPSDDGGETPNPERYKEALSELPPRSVVVVAVPDHLHSEIVLTALRADQHVCCVKPLVLKMAESLEIEREARSRGLLVGVEYHKRFDPRSLLARDRYRDGRFGEFKLGTARLMEKWHYRESNFQHWFSSSATDSFVYIGCHYVDLVHFITGLAPLAVSVYGLLDDLPNGMQGYLWTDARVIWENGACLSVQNSLSFPDGAPGPNTQGMTLYCTGAGRGALIDHSDQYRGLSYSFGERDPGPGGTQYAEPSPDYFLYQNLGGPGLVPTGYGVRSVQRIVSEALRLEHESSSLADRQRILDGIDAQGMLATVSNSRFNVAVCEAARESILDGGRLVDVPQ